LTAGRASPHSAPHSRTVAELLIARRIGRLRAVLVGMLRQAGPGR
jgi:hypothetical protein